MSYHCEICNQMNRYEKKDRHFKSNYHKFFEQPTITRYIIENANIINLTEIIKKYGNIHNTKYSFFEIICVLIVNDNQYIKHRPLTNLDFSFKNIKLRCNFPQILQMRTTVASCRKFWAYVFYIKQPLQAIEMKLNMIIAKNPILINSANRFHYHPSNRKNSPTPFYI